MTTMVAASIVPLSLTVVPGARAAIGVVGIEARSYDCHSKENANKEKPTNARPSPSKKTHSFFGFWRTRPSAGHTPLRAHVPQRKTEQDGQRRPGRVRTPQRAHVIIAMESAVPSGQPTRILEDNDSEGLPRASATVLSDPRRHLGSIEREDPILIQRDLRDGARHCLQTSWEPLSR